MQRALPTAFLVAGAAALAFVEPGYSQFQAPVGGFVFHEPTQSIRPVRGVPGGAFVGEALVSSVDFASVSPNGTAAVVSREHKTSLVTGLADLRPAESAPEGLISSVDWVAWSGSGEVAALCSSTSKLIQRVKFSGGDVTPEAPVDLSFLDGSISTLAVDSRGEKIAVGMEHLTAGGVYLIRADALPAPLAQMMSPVGAVYGARDGALYVADRIATRSLVFVNDAFSDVVPLVEPGSDPVEVVAQSVSSDGRRLYVATRTGPSLRVYDLRSRNLLSAIPLEKLPESLAPVPQSTSLLLNSAHKKNDPLWVMVDDVTPMIRFIPVVEMDAGSL